MHAHRKARGGGSWIVEQLSWRRPNQKNVLALMLGLSPQSNGVEILQEKNIIIFILFLINLYFIAPKMICI